MNTQLVTGAFTLIATLGFSATGYAEDSRPMDACIKAFVEANLSPQQPVKVFKDNIPRNPPYYSSGRYLIEVTATRRHGEQLAHATCVVDRNGAIVAMTGMSKDTIADASK